MSLQNPQSHALLNSYCHAKQHLLNSALQALSSITYQNQKVIDTDPRWGNPTHYHRKISDVCYRRCAESTQHLPLLQNHLKIRQTMP